MISLTFSQYTRPLVETMYISRGGFTSRTHNLISLRYKGHDYFSEVIGDAKLINYLFENLSTTIKENGNINDLQDLFHAVGQWINSFVYLEVHSSVHSIGCAFDWLKVLTTSHLKGISIFDVLDIPKPTRNHTLVYGSNLYWKQSADEFAAQVQEFDYQKTDVLKFHLGRQGPDQEEQLYKIIEAESRIKSYMIDYNCGYSLQQLSEVSSFISSSNILREKLLWLEEPTHPDLASQWKDASSHPLAAGENHHGLDQLASLYRAGLNWIMPDFGRTLFLSDFPKLLKTQPLNSFISFHSYSSGFLAYLSLLISTSLPIEKTLYEHDFSKNALLDDIVKDAIQIKDGIATINQDALHQLNLDSIDPSWSQSSSTIDL